LSGLTKNLCVINWLRFCAGNFYGGEGDCMIEVRHITKRYGALQALDDVSFTAKNGEVLGLLGPNGAGKTTTMRIISSFLAPTEGSVMISGVNVQDNPLEARKKIGYLPEGNPLYKEMSVYESLKFISALRGISKGDVNKAIREVVVLCGLEHRLGDLIGELSKGYQQRLGLAQAILHKPDVLILDEPTSGLDPNQVQEIRSLIREIGKEKTVLFSSHIMQEVEAVCSSLVILNKGKIVAQGSLADIKQAFTSKVECRVGLKIPSRDTMSLVLLEIEKLKGVLSVSPLPQDQGYLRFCVIAKEDSYDPREDIFKLAVRKDWIVMELALVKESLEQIFQKLTLVT